MPRLKGIDQEVGLADEVPEDTGAGVVSDVQGYAALVAVEVDEESALFWVGEVIGEGTAPREGSPWKGGSILMTLAP